MFKYILVFLIFLFTAETLVSSTRIMLLGDSITYDDAYIDHPEWICDVWGGSCSSVDFTSSPVTSCSPWIRNTSRYLISASRSPARAGGPGG